MPKQGTPYAELLEMIKKNEPKQDTQKLENAKKTARINAFGAALNQLTDMIGYSGRASIQKKDYAKTGIKALDDYNSELDRYDKEKANYDKQLFNISIKDVDYQNRQDVLDKNLQDKEASRQAGIDKYNRGVELRDKIATGNLAERKRHNEQIEDISRTRANKPTTSQLNDEVFTTVDTGTLYSNLQGGTQPVKVSREQADRLITLLLNDEEALSNDEGLIYKAESNGLGSVEAKKTLVNKYWNKYPRLFNVPNPNQNFNFKKPPEIIETASGLKIQTDKLESMQNEIKNIPDNIPEEDQMILMYDILIKYGHTEEQAKYLVKQAY